MTLVVYLPHLMPHVLRPKPWLMHHKSPGYSCLLPYVVNSQPPPLSCSPKIVADSGLILIYLNIYTIEEAIFWTKLGSFNAPRCTFPRFLLVCNVSSVWGTSFVWWFDFCLAHFSKSNIYFILQGSSRKFLFFWQSWGKTGFQITDECILIKN